MRDVPIEELLGELGVPSGEPRRSVRGALEAAGLTRAGKQNIVVSKREAVRALLESLAMLCARCAAEHDGTRAVVLVEAEDCTRCAGSDNQRAAARFFRMAAAAGVSRLVVVGGSPGVRGELDALLRNSPVNLRMVVGSRANESIVARANLRWADLVLIWGASEIKHKATLPYSNAREPHVHTVHRRGVAALLDAAVDILERRRRGLAS